MHDDTRHLDTTPTPPGVIASLIRFDLREQYALLRHIIRWILIGAGVGLLAGLSSALLLESLDWVTETRTERAWLLWLLPLAGLAVGWIYHAYGGSSSRGNNLIIDEIHQPDRWVPRRMAPLVYAATVATHLFGGSAGREGTAIQMSGSLSDGIIARAARLTGTDRRLLLIAAISGGFGAVFGVPIAGFIFGLEVQSVGRVRHDAIVPALTAAVVGDQVVRYLDVAHTPVPIIGDISLSPVLTLQLVVAGLAFGAASILFSELTHGIKHLFATTIAWPPLRPFVGGLLVIGLTYVSGSRDYLGLSVPLITGALDEVVAVAMFAFAWKLLFTAVTLGAGFQGGEVTPLFVIGATLGATVGELFDANVPLFAAVGFVAVFAGATNTPIACTVMGVEMFGGGIIVPLAIGCVVSYSITAHRGIYLSQRIDATKLGEVQADPAEMAVVRDAVERRKPWWTARSAKQRD